MKSADSKKEKKCQFCEMNLNMYYKAGRINVQLKIEGLSHSAGHLGKYSREKVQYASGMSLACPVCPHHRSLRPSRPTRTTVVRGLFSFSLSPLLMLILFYSFFIPYASGNYRIQAKGGLPRCFLPSRSSSYSQDSRTRDQVFQA